MVQLDFNEMSRLLSRYGIRYADSVVITAGAKPENIMNDIMKKKLYPATLKAYSTDIVHKAKEGFVATGIRNSEELLNIYKRFMSLAGQKKLKDIVLVAQKEVRGNEFILGAKYDETFGYVLLFGLGGIYTEALNKVALRICPINEKTAIKMVEEISGKFIADESSKKMIAAMLMKLQKLIQKEKIIELDLNPVIVNASGVHLVDTRMVK